MLSTRNPAEPAMNEPGLVTISMNELRRVKIIESVVEGRLSGVRAAGQMGLSERQVSRLRRRFEAAGAAGLVSAKRGRPSNRQFSMNLRARVLAIIRERNADFGPTLASPMLRLPPRTPGLMSSRSPIPSPRRSCRPRVMRSWFRTIAASSATA